MHKVLTISELVAHIVQYLPHRSQLHLGLTCRTLWTGLLPELWSDINVRAFAALLVHEPPTPIRTPPHGEKQGDVGSDEDAENEGISGLKDMDLHRTKFRSYSQHIRRLCLHEDQDKSTFLRVVSLICGGGSTPQAMFPRLRRLDLRVSTVNAILSCRPFLELELEYLAFQLDRAPPEETTAHLPWTAFFDALGRRNRASTPIPAIFIMVVDWESGLPADVDVAIERLLENSTECTSFGLFSLSPTVAQFWKVAGLKNATEISCGIPLLQSTLLLDAGHLLPVAYPVLESLSLYNLDTSVLGVFDRHNLYARPAQILPMVSSERLHDLRLLRFTISSVIEVLPLLQSRWSATLRSISIILPPVRDGGQTSPRLYDFRALLDCRGLQAFRFNGKPHTSTWPVGGVPLQFLDEDIAHIVKAWPQLQILSLADLSFYEVSAISFRTLSTFETLAYGPPNLRELDIAISFDFPRTELGRSDEASGRLSNLVSLNVGVSHTRQPELVSSVIRRCFPRLETFEYINIPMQNDDDPEDMVLAASMKEVKRQLGLLNSHND
ncbi:hypothetical protein CALVIDRAFT_564529 [Calocera viscosa TUFC12733]|uniref:F-box domain-containing protein n=1 Tax=Calocera viscosa (strain TUFC12733) TaxID=1330018 RepID=A0A167LNL4_CALVF|nr:hypothetical protein CALVIDRAFT_564529 [Calocera viscosa TUFC12733]